MKFHYKDQQVLLQGLIPSLGTSFMDCNQLLKGSVRKGLLLQITLAAGVVLEDIVPIEVELLLQEFREVFETPTGLPLMRGHEHQITLIEGSRPVCQRPYEYPFYRKNEIEKIVRELLSVGSIRNSTSPLASPVLIIEP